MKFIDQQNATLRIVLSVALVGLCIIVFESCECLSSDEHVEMLVFAGDRSSEDCRTLVKNHQGASTGLTYICPGEKVTICWSSRGVQGLTLDVGGTTETVSTSGSKVVSIDSDTNIKLSPDASAKCAGSVSFKVDVIDGPTPSKWDGRWSTQKCEKITFTIDEAFMSTSIKARDIRAAWHPIIYYTDEAGNSTYYECTTPPFLIGEQHEEAFGFELTKPEVSVTFSRRLKAVGHWNFVVKANCGNNIICNAAGVYPFDMTLDCE